MKKSYELQKSNKKLSSDYFLIKSDLVEHVKVTAEYLKLLEDNVVEFTDDCTFT